MYYKIKKEKLDELREGKTNSYIAEKTKYSRQYITYIFKQQIKINSATAIKLLMPLAKESIKLNNMLKEKGIDYMIDYFFEEEE